ncbi:MAG: DUF1146 family protein [Candidatus Izemoplasmatales bacterium]|mgnify:CR=1 FL=1|jgi:uncharacterized membrane protein YwzB|nr:DUF1146 family protein [Candidatus Izemoplasmatales bacterium]MDY0138422.1 DUF1146 family protein [Candidatus Izemoplasmatales bacterium]
MLTIVDVNVFLISRIILFFVASIFIFKAIQAIDVSKFFRKNSGDQIRFLFMVVSIILGFLFVDAIVSLFEYLNDLF